MPIQPTDVVAAPVATEPVPAPAAAPASPANGEGELTDLVGQDGEVPEDILRIPAFNAILEGKPAAIYIKQGQTSPELAKITEHSKDLIKSGFGFYKADSAPITVMFNSQFVSPAELAEADKNGTLEQLAEPYDDVKGSYDQLISEDQAKAGKTLTPAPASPGAMPATAPASVLNKITTARTDNLQPGAPTDGPSPGQGRILNALKKTVV